MRDTNFVNIPRIASESDRKSEVINHDSFKLLLDGVKYSGDSDSRSQCHSSEDNLKSSSKDLQDFYNTCSNEQRVDWLSRDTYEILKTISSLVIKFNKNEHYGLIKLFTQCLDDLGNEREYCSADILDVNLFRALLRVSHLGYKELAARLWNILSDEEKLHIVESDNYALGADCAACGKSDLVQAYLNLINSDEGKKSAIKEMINAAVENGQVIIYNQLLLMLNKKEVRSLVNTTEARDALLSKAITSGNISMVNKIWDLNPTIFQKEKLGGPQKALNFVTSACLQKSNRRIVEKFWNLMPRKLLNTCLDDPRYSPKLLSSLNTTSFKAMWNSFKGNPPSSVTYPIDNINKASDGLLWLMSRQNASLLFTLIGSLPGELNDSEISYLSNRTNNKVKTFVEVITRDNIKGANAAVAKLHPLYKALKVGLQKKSSGLTEEDIIQGSRQYIAAIIDNMPEIRRILEQRSVMMKSTEGSPLKRIMDMDFLPANFFLPSTSVGNGNSLDEIALPIIFDHLFLSNNRGPSQGLPSNVGPVQENRATHLRNQEGDSADIPVAGNNVLSLLSPSARAARENSVSEAQSANKRSFTQMLGESDEEEMGAKVMRFV